MGWASGVELLDDVWTIMEPFIEGEPAREKSAKALIEAFEDRDCDTISESRHEIIQVISTDLFYEENPEYRRLDGAVLKNGRWMIPDE